MEGSADGHRCLAHARSAWPPGSAGVGGASTGEAREFHVRTAFGFDNPADTGIVYGLLSPLLMFATARGLSLECRPMFEESGLRGAVSATVQVRPLSVCGAFAAFLRLTFGHASGQVGLAGKEMSGPRSATPVTVGDLGIEAIEDAVVASRTPAAWSSSWR